MARQVRTGGGVDWSFAFNGPWHQVRELSFDQRVCVIGVTSDLATVERGVAQSGTEPATRSRQTRACCSALALESGGAAPRGQKSMHLHFEINACGLIIWPDAPTGKLGNAIAMIPNC